MSLVNRCAVPFCRPGWSFLLLIPAELYLCGTKPMDNTGFLCYLIGSPVMENDVDTVRLLEDGYEKMYRHFHHFNIRGNRVSDVR